MNKSFIWTYLRVRLTFIKSNAGQPYNWLFLPGGPGLGAESLANLTSCLELPGTMWFLDFPGDGSNFIDNEHYFTRWTDALVEATNALDKVIIVAHSTGGMYVLASPNLKKIL